MVRWLFSLQMMNMVTLCNPLGSPSEIMKICEAFSVSVEDSSDPTADATNKGGDPWFYFDGLTTKSALWHYYAFHSTVHTLMDVRYVGSEFDIQFFDVDRTSLYDAAQSFLKSTVFGEAVCDRQGALYFEVGAEATNNAASSLNQSMFIDNHDWMGTPSIVEQYTEETSYLESGGVAYTSYRNGGDGSFAAMMGSAPGVTPAYRGKNLKVSGLALSTQNQLNTLVGNVWESQNADFPEVNLDLVGNFRNLDIAPQEIVTLTVQEDDTFRGISWEQKAFTPRMMSWNYDAKKSLFLPSIALREVTQGNAGQTIVIPPAPPDGGYGQPPIPLPPPVPPIPVPPTLGGTSNFLWAQPQTLDNSDFNGQYYWPGAGAFLRNGQTDEVGGEVLIPEWWTGNSVLIEVFANPAAGSGGFVYGQIDYTTALFADASPYVSDDSSFAQSPSEMDDSGKAYIVRSYTTPSGDVNAYNFLHVYYTRQGGHASDTYANDLYVLGFRITLL
jgi:hypothetical protein